MVDDFRFVGGHVKSAVPKMTIPSPSVVHFRGGRRAIDAKTYPDMDGFFADLGEAYNKAVAAFGAAGCRYLQLDEVNIAYLCDPEQIAGLKARGEHVENLLAIYAGMLNRAIEGRPDGMVISMHLCRGNFRSHWVASGGYEPVAEVLFNQINADAYFMEYDSDRAGGFEPLRFVPRGHKMVVLGLVTSKSGALESKDELKRRIDEAAKYLPLEQLALSPQCGFASTEEGNLLTEEEQWAKLRLCVEVAREVWGGGVASAVIASYPWPAVADPPWMKLKVVCHASGLVRHSAQAGTQPLPGTRRHPGFPLFAGMTNNSVRSARRSNYGAIPHNRQAAALSEGCRLARQTIPRHGGPWPRHPRLPLLAHHKTCMAGRRDAGKAAVSFRAAR